MSTPTEATTPSRPHICLDTACQCSAGPKATPAAAHALNRRQWLRWAAATGAVAATGPLAVAASQPSRAADAPPVMTPDEALAKLEAGNARFVAGETIEPNRDMRRLQQVAPKQAPFAAFLGCADSRVPIEIIFDQGFGDVFVTRIAGNVADPAIIGSLEFGCLVLGAKVLYVLGHSSCGAVAATIKGEAVPGQISTLYQHLRPAAKAAKGDVDAAIRENVKIQAGILAEASPVLAQLIKDGKLKVAGGVYDLATGKVATLPV
jgi:carbonic anhydrase